MNLIFFFVILMNIGIWHHVDSADVSILDIRWWRTAWTKAHGALLYNPEDEQLHDKINEKGNTNCQPCITACPAELLVDKQIINKYSLSKNSLFLKHVYKEFSPGEVQTEICQTAFEPTILFDQTTFTYETGYELYYSEDNDIGLNRNEYSYDNFLPISKMTSNLKRLKRSSAKKTFKLDDEKTWVFYWIPVLSLKFNPLKYQIRAHFKKDAINDYRKISIEKCPEYGLESDTNVNFFNSDNNRLGMSDKLYIPIEINPDAASNESPYLHSYGGLERAPLVPMMFFHTAAAKNATCTLMNTIPIWTSILRGHLKRIDNYLYTIYRMWQSKVNIIFGASGISRVKVPDNWMMGKEKFEVKKKPKPFVVSYPKIIYRVVEYGTGKPAEKSYAVIIIHNDRTATKSDKLCKTTEDHWTFINNDDSKTGISYVCLLTRSIAEKLGVDSPPKKVDSLQLFDMNHIRIGGKLKGTDERENIKEEMKKLFPDVQIPAENVKMTDSDEIKEETQPEPGLETSKQPRSPTFEYPEDQRFWVIDGTAGKDF